MSTTDLLNIDRVVHEPARLLILTVLSAVASSEFKFLQSATGLSKGNLSSHLSKLEAAGYVMQTKKFRGKTPVTTISITKAGTRSLKQYRVQMAALLGESESKRDSLS